MSQRPASQQSSTPAPISTRIENIVAKQLPPVRDWTQNYLKLRENARRRQEELSRVDVVVASTVHDRAEFEHTEEPDYMRSVAQLDQYLVALQQEVKQLEAAHQKRLRVSFGADDESSHDAAIRSHTEQIGKLMRSADRCLRSIASSNSEGVSQQEAAVRVALLRTYSAKLQEINKQSRQAQKSFLDRPCLFLWTVTDPVCRSIESRFWRANLSTDQSI